MTQKIFLADLNTIEMYSSIKQFVCNMRYAGPYGIDINNAFTWSETPEGQDYWEKLFFMAHTVDTLNIIIKINF